MNNKQISKGEKRILKTAAAGFGILEGILILASPPLALAQLGLTYVATSTAFRVESYKKGECVIDRSQKDLEELGYSKLGKALKYTFYPENIVKDVYSKYNRK